MSNAESDNEEERDNFNSDSNTGSKVNYIANANVFQSVWHGGSQFDKRYTMINEESPSTNQVTHSYRVILVGDFATGKTSLLNSLVRNTELPSSTNKLVEMKKTFNINAITKVVITVSDTNGEERYGKPPKFHYIDVHGAVVVFDLTKENTFTNVDMWINEVKDHAPKDCCFLIIGNKVDNVNERKVTQNKIKELKTKYKCDVVEASARTGNNEELAFQQLAKEMVEKEINGPPPGEEVVVREKEGRESIKIVPEVHSNKGNNNEEKKKKKKCC
jgi:small GTP-binding protein